MNDQTQAPRSPATSQIPAQAGAEVGGDDVVRVLVVDDTMEVRLLVGLLLQDEPTWTVVGEASNGAEAIKRAIETEPDMVLLDISMPVMDGLEALPGLRSALPDALLVLLTAFPVSDINDMAVAAGADACLDKVNMATSLMPALRDLLAEKSFPSPRSGSDGPREG